MRWPIIALTLVLALSRAAAQDMPLSQILIDGEGWKEVPRGAPVFPPHLPPVRGGAGVEQATCSKISPDFGTAYVGSAAGKYIWAFRVEKGSLTAGQPYCSLRVPRGEKDMLVTALTVDRDGRIYAATRLGVQVFDPTGRLCGVLAQPSPDLLVNINLVGDRLYVATERNVYARRLNTREPPPPSP